MIKNERIVEYNLDLSFISPCSFCVHKFIKSPGCPAFKIIPNKILLGEVQHTKPLPEQDNDIVFKKGNPNK